MQAHSYHVKIGEGRRVVLPSEVCQSMSVAIGDTIIVRVEDNHLVRLETPEFALQEARAYFKSLVPKGVSVVDELLVERREEASRE